MTTCDNPQLYSIQAGRPFWYTDSGGKKGLVAKDNGLTPDIFDSRGQPLGSRTLAAGIKRII